MNKSLIQWSSEEFSDLPWRSNRTLYRTLVSEIMLQQTTVSTVLNHFERFVSEYPSPKHVALASEEQLTISWKGLGYYRRARNLKKACEYFCKNFNGEIPLDYNLLIDAPGIGEYTANALLAIGADKKALALDANLERVLSRLYGFKMQKGPKLLKHLKSKFEKGEIAKEIDELGARKLNESLMDLGRNWCKANKAACDICPLFSGCMAAKSGSPLEIPQRPPKSGAKSFNLTLLRLICFKDDLVYVYKKRENEWLSGQYEIPTFVLSSEDQTLTQYPPIKFFEHDLLPEYKTLITKYKITNKVMIVNEVEMRQLNIDVSQFELRRPDSKSNLSTATLKALKIFT